MSFASMVCHSGPFARSRRVSCPSGENTGNEHGIAIGIANFQSSSLLRNLRIRALQVSFNKDVLSTLVESQLPQNSSPSKTIKNHQAAHCRYLKSLRTTAAAHRWMHQVPVRPARPVEHGQATLGATLPDPGDQAELTGFDQ